MAVQQAQTRQCKLHASHMYGCIPPTPSRNPMPLCIRECCCLLHIYGRSNWALRCLACQCCAFSAAIVSLKGIPHCRYNRSISTPSSQRHNFRLLCSTLQLVKFITLQPAAIQTAAAALGFYVHGKAFLQVLTTTDSTAPALPNAAFLESFPMGSLWPQAKQTCCRLDNPVCDMSRRRSTLI